MYATLFNVDIFEYLRKNKINSTELYKLIHKRCFQYNIRPSGIRVSRSILVKANFSGKSKSSML
jgi:hypothetical protein